MPYLLAAKKLAARPPGWRSIPRAVWALGFVSLLMDMSSEAIHSLVPVFLVSVLGAGAATVGLIEGVAEATASIAKIFSGTLSDRLRERKRLAVLGYGMGALSKPLFALATTPNVVFVARFVDRIGKGIRGAPRDALIGDIAPAHLRGASYGLRQSLDTVGAVAGPLLATALMALTNDSYRVVFWVAVIPAVACVALLVFRVHEPSHPAPAQPAKAPMSIADFRRLGARFWWLTAVFGVFTLARFSEAFLVLRAADVGLRVEFVPMVLVAMNIVYAVSSYPAGYLSDRMDRRHLLGMGFAVLVAADLVLAFCGGIEGAFVGVALWGLHMGLTQGIFAALVADVTAPERRGTAFGLFNLAGGVAMLLASLLAGWLWDIYGASATFLAGAFITAVAAAGIVVLRRHAMPG
jgi:MFS family permease